MTEAKKVPSAETKFNPALIHEDRCIGSLLGHFVGDVLGFPVEGLGPEDIRQRFGKVTDFLEASQMGRPKTEKRFGMYTDDTNSMLALAESLVKLKSLNGADTALSYANAWQTEPIRGYPKSAEAVMQQILEGVDYRKTGTCQFEDGSYANGGAMRIAPIGLVFSHKDPATMHLAVSEAIKSSHVHPEAVDGAYLVAMAISMLLELEGPKALSPEEFLDRLIPLAQTPGMKANMAILRRFVHNTSWLASDKALVKELGEWFQIKAIEAVPCALWVLIKCWNDPEDCLIRAVNMGGDTDTVAAIAGGMAGALHGTKWIPTRWLDNIENGTRGRDFAIGLGRDLSRLKLDGGSIIQPSLAST